MPTTRAPEPAANPDESSARGQRVVLLMAKWGRSLGGHIGRRVGNADLAANVPVIVLCELASRGPLRPRDLVEATQLTSGGITKQLDHLEELGLIERSFGTIKVDRRGSVVSLTPEGSRVAAVIGEAAEERLDELRAILRELSTVVET